jgi:plastocyanin
LDTHKFRDKLNNKKALLGARIGRFRVRSHTLMLSKIRGIARIVLIVLGIVVLDLVFFTVMTLWRGDPQLHLNPLNPWDALHAYVNPDEASDTKTAPTARAAVVAAAASVAGVFVQILAGLFLIFGLYFTRKTLLTTQEGQITDRFTKAVDQLAARTEGADGSSPGHKHIERRLGGIYALERIARDSPRDYWPVMEVLSGYLRVNHPWHGLENPAVSIPWSGTDALAVLKVLRDRQHSVGHPLELRPLNLSQLNLEWGDLRGAHLEGADLRSSCLRSADLSKASLQPFLDNSSHLEHADLTEANLSHANLTDAHLDKANLTDADLTSAVLLRSDLSKAILERANLRGADLSDARGLVQTQIDQAYMNMETNLSGTSDPSGQPLKPSTRQTPIIEIKDGAFFPRQLDVDVGTTVTWVNPELTPHVAVSKDGSFSSPTLTQFKSFKRRFDAPGTYAYTCGIHDEQPEHGGTVVVKQASSSNPQADSLPVVVLEPNRTKTESATELVEADAPGGTAADSVAHDTAC